MVLCHEQFWILAANLRLIICCQKQTTNNKREIWRQNLKLLMAQIPLSRKLEDPIFSNLKSLAEFSTALWKQFQENKIFSIKKLHLLSQYEKSSWQGSWLCFVVVCMCVAPNVLFNRRCQSGILLCGCAQQVALKCTVDNFLISALIVTIIFTPSKLSHHLSYFKIVFLF